MRDISKIIAKKLLKSANKEELDTLKKWSEKSNINSTFINSLNGYFESAEGEVQDARLESVRKRLQVRLVPGSMSAKRSYSLYLSRIAAVAVLVLSVALSFYLGGQAGWGHTNDWVKVSTEAGQRSKLVLPDGSKVWLNADTDLYYKVGRKIRQVKMNGEAYFVVKHAEDHPFEVETGNGTIRVLGTQFNVSHYKGSGITEASLLKGNIEMIIPGHKKVIHLQPGEKVVFNAPQKQFVKSKVNVEKEILWKEGILVFENESFDQMVEKLERYYAVKIIYPEQKFKDIHYTGTIDNLRLNDLMEFLSLTIPMQYEINQQQIILK
jgi:ferric-dicitrate binding protein FerR (iron transport regulator)